ncbi:MAG: CbiX/SirB N-terminal domain-containing protein [gamma proteobacterium endosymbiont of Lamellibrachia anaximandri]|nr:CbiX/SirB N-terminal domain-containing protein [gamma proteobacterium endosymbiont of Lamellibrachia anaximandri]MBL3533260.1 CbiX/SirB N-terminal domain-containing protein [gamma proteobacterium endosymbiont of Lamellibrachia anaximandri]
MSRALLIVAHGSRREASNEEIRRLTERVRAEAGDSYQSVSCAYLELADPSIPAGIEQCIDGGAEEVVVLPYFLSAGRHVSLDIPQEVEATQRKHPGVRIRIAPYLGGADGISAMLLDSAAEDRG